MSGQEHNEKPARDRDREWPTILLLLKALPPEVPKRLLELAGELEWKLLNSAHRGGLWPESVDPQGALVNIPHGDYLDELMSRGCPTVRIGRAPNPNDSRVPAAVPDLRAVGRMAAEHFSDRGFRHVGFVGYDIEENSPYAIQGAIYDGLRERTTELECECHLLSFDSRAVPESISHAERYQRRRSDFAEWARDIPKPLALLTFSDRSAATLCCMCDDEGIVVPHDIAVLGVGNDEFDSTSSMPPTSSVVLNHAAQAKAATHLLQQLMAGKPVPQATVLIPPVEIVERESTNTLATADAKVAAAVRHMWDNLRVNISVDDVARAVGLSRRTLDRRFRRELGRSVSAELLRKRLQELCLLLRTTEEKVIDLAPRTGFPSPEHLHRVFRREFGITPREYRRQRDRRG